MSATKSGSGGSDNKNADSWGKKLRLDSWILFKGVVHTVVPKLCTVLYYSFPHLIEGCIA